MFQKSYANISGICKEYIIVQNLAGGLTKPLKKKFLKPRE